jgi:hypothetical protein
MLYTTTENIKRFIFIFLEQKFRLEKELDEGGQLVSKKKKKSN